MSDTEEKEATEAITSEVIEEKVDKRKTRTSKQLEALRVAREKAMEMRKGNAEHTRKAKEIKQYQKEEKRKEVERLYEEMIAKQKKKDEPEPEPEPILEHKVKRRKPTPNPTPEPEASYSESEHEPTPLNNAPVNKNPVASKNIDMQHNYKYAFEYYH